MKLTGIFVGLLVIFLITEGTIAETIGGPEKKAITSVTKFVVNLKDIVKAASDITAKLKVFGGYAGLAAGGLQTVVTLIDTINGESSEAAQLKKQHKEVMEQLSMVSNQITDVSRSILQGFDQATKDIVDKIEINSEFGRLTHRISDKIQKINVLYGNSEILRSYPDNRVPTRERIQNFIDDVSKGSTSISFLIGSLNEALFGSGTSALEKSYLQSFSDYYTKWYTERCNKFVSPHKRLYDIYLTLLTTEYKALLVTCHAYEWKMILNPTQNYTNEMEVDKNQFVFRIRRYMTEVSRSLQTTPRDIRRCDVPKDQAVFGQTYVEFRNFSFFIVETEDHFNGIRCKGDCHETSEVELNGQHYKFPVGSATHFTDENVEFCFSHGNSGGPYDWIKVGGQAYGRVTDCDPQYHLTKQWAKYGSIGSGGSYVESGGFNICDMCAVTYYGQALFESDSHLTDIDNNMVATGMRFVRTDTGAISIQLKQGKLLPDGFVNDTEVWTTPIRLPGRPSSHEVMTRDKRILYLDDVILPPNYVVTGVQFVETRYSDGIKIIVRGTQYDYITGELDVWKNDWFDPESRPVYVSQKLQGRSEILNENLDNPLESTFNEHDPSSKRYIAFTHTSFKRDAGKATIPFFDAQPVTMSTAMPLNGIGIFHKAAKGVGGFIAPRIFTDSIERYIDVNLD